MTREYVIPHGKHPNVYKGDKVAAGQQLTDGPVVLQDILRVCGDKVLQEYLVNEVRKSIVCRVYVSMISILRLLSGRCLRK